MYEIASREGVEKIIITEGMGKGLEETQIVFKTDEEKTA